MKKTIAVLFILALMLPACTRSTDKLFLQAAQEAVNNYDLVGEQLDTRILEFEGDHQLLRDPVWAADSLQVLADLKNAAEAFRVLPEFSDKLSNLNDFLLQVADETDLYVEAMNTAINNLDTDGVSNARAHRETIGDYLNDAQNEIIRYLAGK